MLALNKTEDRKLPVGMKDFDQLIQDLKDAYGDELPTTDDDSLRFVLSATIMHLTQDDSHKSLEFFYKRIVAGASKQIAHAVFQAVKIKQQEKAAAEESAKKAELEVSNEIAK